MQRMCSIAIYLFNQLIYGQKFLSENDLVASVQIIKSIYACMCGEICSHGISHTFK